MNPLDFYSGVKRPKGPVLTPAPQAQPVRGQEERALMLQLRGARLSLCERTRIQMRLDELRAQANG